MQPVMPRQVDQFMSESTTSLYERLGGYDAISAVVQNLLPRLMADSQLGRFWANRGADGIEREKKKATWNYDPTNENGTPKREWVIEFETPIQARHIKITRPVWGNLALRHCKVIGWQ